jgi:hypothetical protein
LHHGKDGEVVAVSFGSVENDYRIALDKESHLQREVIVTVTHSQKFPYPDEAVAVGVLGFDKTCLRYLTSLWNSQTSPCNPHPRVAP